ncbi:sugar ABC transporter permease [Tessaracoccus sp. OS52]|uniref:carbohydrate ABC transporter permease n=1 Tax=Tessaracoccus sp. OS52 TaxID=2886691 RepID=UPI001D10CCE7|nr:sugar ABC transporter permease [Tessaracoccus sp. OS52]MCC2591815.1 sugar ABC transporter permease [Tessaracoccus sp. OS52]
MTLTTATSTGGDSIRRLRWSRQRRHTALVGAAFLAPLLLGLLVFRAFGFGYNVYLSFTRTGAFGPSQWVGLENFERLAGDALFLQAVGNTVKFVALGVPAIVVVSLFSAVLLHRVSRGSTLLRTVLFLPAVTMPVSILLVFQWLFNTDYGLINAAITGAGGDRVNWFGTDFGVTLVFVVAMTYMSSAIPMLIVLSNLQAIPTMYREAAMLDGATHLRLFRHITLPLLTPSLFYVTTTNIISMFQMFSLPYVLLPEGAQGLRFGQTLVHYYFNAAFSFSGQRGYAAAISIALLGLILVVTLVNFGLQKKWVNYDH